MSIMYEQLERWVGCIMVLVCYCTLCATQPCPLEVPLLPPGCKNRFCLPAPHTQVVVSAQVVLVRILNPR